MSRASLKVLGFALSFGAMIAFVLHPNHHLLETSHETSSHCAVCHAVPMGVSLPQADYKPLAYVVYEITAPAQVRQFSLHFSVESPRGPPIA
jgi:hypothetical protein